MAGKKKIKVINPIIIKITDKIPPNTVKWNGCFKILNEGG